MKQNGLSEKRQKPAWLRSATKQCLETVAAQSKTVPFLMDVDNWQGPTLLLSSYLR